jgi:hypothetical protein
MLLRIQPFAEGLLKADSWESARKKLSTFSTPTT